MATVDLSRAAFEPQKRYPGVRVQQGRVNLDDDFNEAARIEDDHDQRRLVHIIGPSGAPDGGFLVSNPHAVGTQLDFDIGAGTMYLGGVRVWNPHTVDFIARPDWLLQPASERAKPSDGRIDLVYLEMWRQAVSAVEDAELFEAALAGPDTSARVRTMWRVRLAQDIHEKDCPSAWSALNTAWAAKGLGHISPLNDERITNGVLTVGLEPGLAPGDLCSPPVAGGYLGADNQAIRVELVDATHFTWGFDNAAPLYRVKIGADRKTIELETEPKDQGHWPIAGQTVEILPWSAVLPNNEKLAELSGHLSQVQGSYDPTLHKITLQTAVPAGFGEQWTTRSDVAKLVPSTADRHYYLRVWNRGDDSSSAAISFSAGTTVPLGATGLNVTFSGTEFVEGDYWIIAARPDTPDELVPWSFKQGRPPHGVRRFYTPLAIVQWHVSGNNLTWDLLHDCRNVFPPLTRIQTCCTFTVGDEKESFGRFTSIQAAVDALPPQGGKVCVLSGDFHEQVTIKGRHNVTIEGCGAQSRLHASEKEDGCGILITQSQDVTIRGLTIQAGPRPGIVVWDPGGATPLGSSGTKPGLFGALFELAKRSARIVLDDLVVFASELPAVAAWGVSWLTLRNSTIELGPLLKPIGAGPGGRWPAVYVQADDVLIEGNDIHALSSIREPLNEAGIPTFTTLAMGGIQVAGGSERVEIRRNTITGGNSDGITLGSWAWLPAPMIDFPWEKVIAAWQFSALGEWLVIGDDGCIEIIWDPVPPRDGNGGPMMPVSMGDLTDITIIDNTISEMGRCGVGVARWWPLNGRDELIGVHRLTIEHNRIRTCLQRGVPELPPSLRDAAAAGAIALASAEMVVIRDNRIEQNGRSHLEPVCGVFFLRTVGILVERNYILDNAPRVFSRDRPRSGFRGGVFVLQALPPSTWVFVVEQVAPRANGVPAARIVGNVIVVPEGRCIVLLGQGTFAITDNQLTSRGVATADRGFDGGHDVSAISNYMDAVGGCTVFVYNLGRSNEVGSQIALLQSMKDMEISPQPGLDPTVPVLAGGDTLFAHNQVTLDLIETGIVMVGCSVVISSAADDVEVDGNQMQVEQFGDRIVVHAMIAARSARFANNRCEESLIALDGVAAPGVSVFVFCDMGVVTSNITTYCIMLIASLGQMANNIATIQGFNSSACGGANSVATSLTTRYVRG